MLAALMLEIEQAEQANDYDNRNRLTWQALSYAAMSGYPVGFDYDVERNPEYPMVAMIELPTGQVSWHMPRFPQLWDGHDTPEKYRRVREYAAMVDAEAPGGVSVQGAYRIALRDPYAAAGQDGE